MKKLATTHKKAIFIIISILYVIVYSLFYFLNKKNIDLSIFIMTFALSLFGLHLAWTYITDKVITLPYGGSLDLDKPVARFLLFISSLILLAMSLAAIRLANE